MWVNLLKIEKNHNLTKIICVTCAALELNLPGKTVRSYTQTLVSCKCLQDMCSNLINIFSFILLLMCLCFNRYPYGHEELAICEDIDQV